MSAIVKTKLKAAREALAKKDYEKAKSAASDALDYEPDNYNATVFLGLALLELGDVEQSEQMYLKALKANPDQPLALQGLTKLYETSRKWDQYAESLEKLAHLFAKATDAVKCAETLQKLIQLRRDEYGSAEIADTLTLLLPGSPFYPVLSTLPPPDPTNPTGTTTFLAQSAIHNSLPILEEIVSIVEKNEQSAFEKEVQKRRTRLGAAGPEQIKRDVGREIWGASKLPELYQEIMSHPNASDELRREAESKLLKHKQQLLFALPTTDAFATQKAKLASEVQDLVSGMVLIKIPNELAWTLFIESKDAKTLLDYDTSILSQYVKMFDSPLAQMILAYFALVGIDLAAEAEEDEPKKKQAELSEEDFVGTILDLFPDVRNSVLANRIVAEVYHLEEDHENVIKVAEDGLEVAAREEQNRGIKLSQVKLAFNVLLANALVHFFPPKHHARARRIIDEVLWEDPDNIRSLMDRGYIQQYAKQWVEASETFYKISGLLPEDLDDGLRAKEEVAWSKAQVADPDSGVKALRVVLEVLDNLEGRDHDQARCWWRLGQCYWKLEDPDSVEEAYKCYITSLKRLSTFAPAFTSLGIYYAEARSPPDPQRASKCFQKAFELDPREAEAARRLAEGFAEEREWDLVEVVARRTIEGEGGVESASTTRYQPLNAWAWKAVGVVELNRGRYPAAIDAFQIALRSDPDDQLSWLRLGEAYSKASRLAAALKALGRARELKPDDWICAYFLAEVYRQMGQFQQAIDAFAEILQTQPSELRVLLTLAQTHLEFGRAQLAASFTARAEASFVESIRVVLTAVDLSPGFRRIAWKTAADALYELAKLSTFSDVEVVASTVEHVVPLVLNRPADHVFELFPSSPALNTAAPALMSQSLLEVALHAYSYRNSLGFLDDTSGGSGSYDLAVVLAVYARRVAGREKHEGAHKAAVKLMKDAIGFDPLNDRYWHALGDLYFISHPKTAQHAYVKALELDNKNFVTWTNLGLFYLYHGDTELANEAFYRAQVLNPDYTLAWVGQGLVAAHNGDHQHEHALFEHAVTLPIAVPYADVAFSRRLFDRLNAGPYHATSPEAFTPAFFVLDRFCRRQPEDANALHLFGLICERVGHSELAIRAIGDAIALLEAAYEESEDPQIEQQFAIAHTNMGRLRLSLGDYEAALESFATVTGLLAEAENSVATVLLTQSHLGSGIANYKAGAMQEAVESLESATAAVGDSAQLRGHAVVLLSQALWALGTDEGREAAKTQLLQSVADDPDNLMAINALGGMGILTDDDSLIDAALSELLALPLEERQQRDPRRDVDYLLMQHHLAQGDLPRALAVVQKLVLREPSRSQSRRQLAALALQAGNPTSARAVLDAASAGAGPSELRRALGLGAIAAARADPEAARGLAQKAVMLAPWEASDWRACAYSRCAAA
ncbi:TPR-like protein [Phanerochaete sordida]|uniref:TPR-like protein n=1 Tax=Phanerochaete sordida TaxID=48140 RepID=A0A9P3GK68_9APHY|nr:TPR-like protein [Phanerochaete sordida]